uniref:CSON009022 protein n=1 Tax=Culicoides sonorensis TaxID=179676 RepID=A0A336LJW0_CULSO
MMSQGVSAAGSIASLSGSSENISDESNQLERNKRNSFGGSSTLSNKSKKPPWRAIINPAPPPKPDKQAMYKAKMLDATRLPVSRRAIIKQRMQGCQNASMQTDPLPTKCMKDVSIDQKGLIILKDQEILTDGNVLIKKEDGKFILTNSVAILTDLPLREDAATQTALPRSEIDYRQFIEPDVDAIRKEVDQIFEVSQSNRAKHKHEIDALLKELKGTSDEPLVQETHVNEELSSVDSLDIIPDNAEQIKARLSSYEAQLPRRPHFNTHSQWSNLDFPDYEIPPSLPRRTQSDGVAPWNNFKDLVLGDRLSRMSLPPVCNAPIEQQKTRSRSVGRKTVSWSDSHQRAVNELIAEASNLITVFDKISILLGPSLGNLAQIPSIEALKGHVTVPQNTNNYRTASKEACAQLQRQLNEYKPIDFAFAPDLPPELKQYETM